VIGFKRTVPESFRNRGKVCGSDLLMYALTPLQADELLSLGSAPAGVGADRAERFTVGACISGRYGSFFGLKFPPDYSGVLILFQSGDYGMAVFEASKRGLFALADCLPICLLIWVEKDGKRRKICIRNA